VSGLLYPTLPGVTFNSIRSYVWNTGVQTALSRKQTTIAYQQYPVVRYTLLYEFLRDLPYPSLSSSELKALQGLCNQMMGRYDTFLYTDPLFNSVTAFPFGTGNGTTVLFPITAVYENTGGPGAVELIQNFNGTPSFYSNGTLISSSTYTLGPTTSIDAGYIQFNTAPANTVALTWTGSFYYRCRFDDDTADFTEFMQSLWELKKLSFTSVIQ
jgi:hypothetical protein